MHVEIRPFGRAHATLSEAHRAKAFQVPSLSAVVFAKRSSLAPHEEALTRRVRVVVIVVIVHVATVAKRSGINDRSRNLRRHRRSYIRDLKAEPAPATNGAENDSRFRLKDDGRGWGETREKKKRKKTSSLDLELNERWKWDGKIGNKRKEEIGDAEIFYDSPHPSGVGGSRGASSRLELYLCRK